MKSKWLFAVVLMLAMSVGIVFQSGVAASPPADSPECAGISAESVENAAQVADCTSKGEPGQASNVPNAPFSPEVVLYDNGPLVTQAGAGAGGADLSELQTVLGLTVYGFAHQTSTDFRVSDQFTVTGAGWQIDEITFYAYQTGSTTTSTINELHLQIWDGNPSSGTASVVWGNLTTNVLSNSVWSNIYRALDTDPLASDRPIMANTATVGVTLAPGTYWLDWETGGTLSSGPWAPPVTIVGQTTTGDALQYDGTAWNPLLDGTFQQDLPFIIEGVESGGPTSTPAPTATATATPEPGAQEVACNAGTVTFEAGIPDSFTTANTGNVYWSTTDDLNACDNGGNLTGGTGNAACADSDETNTAGDPYQAQMWTNAIDLTSATSATLNYLAVYRNLDSGDFFDVDASTDGGTTWTNLLSWNEDHEPGEAVAINLDTYAGQSVIVRYNYYGDGWDWFAQVDDISLNCELGGATPTPTQPVTSIQLGEMSSDSGSPMGGWLIGLLGLTLLGAGLAYQRRK
ncbi:MAG: hypothetical protein KDD73_15190 [Anaerolineales bacterium]|nr:hypothetical protein [Anaerolineales bacterium]